VSIVVVNFYGGPGSYAGNKMGWWNRIRYITARALLLGDDVHVDVLFQGVHYACLRGSGNVRMTPDQVDKPRLRISLGCIPMIGPWMGQPHAWQYDSVRSVLDVLGLLPRRCHVWNCVQATAHLIGLTDRVRTPRQLRRAIRTRGDQYGWLVLVEEKVVETETGRDAIGRKNPPRHNVGHGSQRVGQEEENQGCN